MHIKVCNMTKCLAMHMMTCHVLVFKTPEVLQRAGPSPLAARSLPSAVPSLLLALEVPRAVALGKGRGEGLVSGSKAVAPSMVGKFG